MARFFVLRSRSPSVISLRSLNDPMYQRYQVKARRHWKEIFASFILLACFLMVLMFIAGWNKNMTSDVKSFRGPRQRGPFGLPKTASAEDEELTTEEVGQRPLARSATEAPQDDVQPRVRTHVGMMTPAVDAVTEPALGTSAEQGDQHQEQGGGQMYAAPRAAVTDGGEAACNTSLCRHMKDWFDATVGSQADPCKEWNTFVCQASVAFPSFDSSPAKHVATTEENRTDDPTVAQKHATSEADGQELMMSCLKYARNLAEGVQDVLSFLEQFNLDLRRMVDDPTDDPVQRMMQLSLEYGVDTPVSFSRKYDVTAEASAPFTVQITLNPEVNEFVNALHSLEEDDADDFYQFLLAHYALVDDANVTEQLMDADEEIAQFVNKTAAAGSGQPFRMSLAGLANSTGISTEHSFCMSVITDSDFLVRAAVRWRWLFSRFGLSKQGVNEHVTADEPALALVAYLSRPEERLAMRRVLAWNVLRYLVGPKADVVAALNRTRAAEDVPDKDAAMPTSETKCRRLVNRLSGVPHRVLDLFDGKAAVPAAAISAVTGLMSQLQDAVASIFKGGATNGSPIAAGADSTLFPTANAASQAALFPDSRRRDLADPKHLFVALAAATKSTTGTMLQVPVGPGDSFPQRWLRGLRAWHGLPPLAQALLPAMTSAVSVDSPAAFFRPPFYVPGAPPEYNLAALGQVIAKALAHKLVERRRFDPAVGGRWRSFWQSRDTSAANDSTYCLHAGHNKNDTWRQRRMNESELADGARLDELLGSGIAYLAFQRTRLATTAGSGGRSTTTTELLPGVNLSSRQLFFIMHCALGCAMGGQRSPAELKQRCMVVYQARRRFVDRHCGQLAEKGSGPNDCRYI
ncbi:uncharacterized protein LOC142591351 [Dermacentor variabilis]|uniref:uncharacterized protein LOC142591351 n=1 Tax=Dermacentor variabilis TaxID=34621 RepID=UPI003F5C0B3C